MPTRISAFLLAALLVLPAAQAQNRPPRQRTPPPAAQPVPAAPVTPAARPAPIMNPSSALLGQMMLPTPNAYRNADGRPGPQLLAEKCRLPHSARLDPNQHR